MPDLDCFKIHEFYYIKMLTKKKGFTLPSLLHFYYTTAFLGTSQCRFQYKKLHNKWFSWFNLKTHDSYFTILAEVFTNHILAEKTYITNHLAWTEHKTMVLKPANKYKIIRQFHNFENFLINDSLHHPMLCRAKVL